MWKECSSSDDQAILEQGGKTLLFYHDNALPGGGSHKRSILMQEIRYDSDGNMPC